MRRPLSTARAIALGALTVGTLDLLDAFVFFGLRSGRAPVQILQGIAAGLLGRASFEGGMTTALLGFCLHFFIATSIVSVYMIASRKMPSLVEHPWRYGAMYGIVAYIVMSQVVVPLSALSGGNPPWPVVLNGVLIHIAGVGIPSAWAARAARPVAAPVPEIARS